MTILKYNMINLTEIAYYTRKAVVWVSIGLVVFLILRFIAIQVINVLTPTAPPAKPTVSFGKLPGPTFPSHSNEKKPIYRLETKEGGLPIATGSARVYPIRQQNPSLLASQRAREFAARLNFTNEPVQTTPTVYEFSDLVEPRVLTLDSVTNNFSIRYNYSSYPDSLSVPPLSPNRAIEETLDFFKNLRMLPASIDEGGKTTLLYFDGKSLVEASSLSSAQVIRVDFFEKPIEEFPLVTETFIHSPIYSLYTGQSDEKKRFIEIGFSYFPIDTSLSATYPLKSVQTAWEELNRGEGYIASGGNQQDVIIRRAYLAYFRPSLYQAYLEPVFVFEGDNDFAAYIAAITAEWSQPR